MAVSEVDLTKLVSEAVTRNAKLLNTKSIGLKRAVSKARVFSDPRLLALVLDLLLDNAVKFSGEGAVLALPAGKPRKAYAFRWRIAAPGSQRKIWAIFLKRLFRKECAPGFFRHGNVSGQILFGFVGAWYFGGVQAKAGNKGQHPVFAPYPGQEA